MKCGYLSTSIAPRMGGYNYSLVAPSNPRITRLFKAWETWQRVRDEVVQKLISEKVRELSETEIRRALVGCARSSRLIKIALYAYQETWLSTPDIEIARKER